MTQIRSVEGLRKIKESSIGEGRRKNVFEGLNIS